MLKNLKDFNICFITFRLFYLFIKNEIGIISKNIRIDWRFLILLLILSLILFVAISKIIETQESNNIFFISLCMYFIFLYLFSINNLINFYIMFELSVLPLIFLISYWGYSLERVKSMFYMFLYTFFFSFPFFIVLVIYSNQLNFNILINREKSIEINLILYILMLGFMLVKIPMWGTHLWLMKAHVEASTEGSIILARIVLKLSGVAFIKIIFFLPPLSLKYNFLSSILISARIIGAIFLSLYTLRQADLKLLVAISSVVHISFIFILFNFISYFRVNTLILVIVSHGLVSPIIFLFLGLIYEETSSRSILFKGILKNIIFVRIVWFFICIFNIAVPVSINFIAEIFFFYASASFNLLICIISAILIFINGVFNIYAYCSITIGQNKIYMSQYIEAMYVYKFYSVFVMVALFFFC